ncbi:DUF3352 domain-containing protein [Cuspidothrix issatschenkoi LEGE 03284]|uniref:DUF3352 domain-containing protein n=1 Tax=Cuspidothrix issatschenkoi TaxID=230752 RepID=UPI00187FA2E6|nr:DUF3352 domain-containing protein [Cuspidothrix issatschenkoi]MBE9234118.1 DUF3352 domain-containing protein [Cuspidothrix issatschenkoi LEGE 03284]
MPEKKSSLLIPVIGTVIILAGGISAYMYLKGGGSSSNPLGSAKLVPVNALMATYIDTKPESWDKLTKFGTPEARKIIGKGLQDFNQQILNDNSISYAADIKPWVGGVMIAVLPPDNKKTSPVNLRTSEEPNILLVVDIQDKIAALNFANKLKQQKNVKTQESDYKGEKIIETKAQGEPTYTTVLNNNHLLFTSNKQAVEKIAALNPESPKLPPQTLAQIKQVKSLVAGVGVDDMGLRFKAVLNLDPELNKFQYESTPAKIVGQFPSETFALSSGQGINKSWQTFVAQSKDYPELNQGLQQARTQLKTWELDLDQDIFSWMTGEFGIGAIQSNQGLLKNLGFGGALVLDTSDRKTAEATFTKLDNLAKQQSLNVANRNIGGKNVTEWQIPQQGALISHGWLDNDTVFLAIGGPIAETLANRKGQALDQSETFKSVTGSLQTPNAGYFYLDMEKTTTIIERLAAQSQPLPPDAIAILNSIRGLGVTVNSPDKSMTQMEMLFALKPTSGK